MRFRVLILAMAVLLACSGCAGRPDTANMKKSRLQAGMLSPPDTLELLLEQNQLLSDLLGAVNSLTAAVLALQCRPENLTDR